MQSDRQMSAADTQTSRTRLLQLRPYLVDRAQWSNGLLLYMHTQVGHLPYALLYLPLVNIHFALCHGEDVKQLVSLGFNFVMPAFSSGCVRF